MQQPWRRARPNWNKRVDGSRQDVTSTRKKKKGKRKKKKGKGKRKRKREREKKKKKRRTIAVGTCPHHEEFYSSAGKFRVQLRLYNQMKGGGNY